MSSAPTMMDTSSSSPSSSSSSLDALGERTKEALKLVKGKRGADGCLLKMLVMLIEGEAIPLKSGPFTLDDFLAEFKNGKAKEAIEEDWRVKNGSRGSAGIPEKYHNTEIDDRLVEYEAETKVGQHEWIPTSEVAYVAEFCAMNKSHVLVQMATTLRSPTQHVIFNPAKYGAFTGHVGALYTSTGKAVTTGQGPFHDALRNLLYACFTGTTALCARYHSGLEDFFRDHCWDGVTRANEFLQHGYRTLDNKLWDQARLQDYRHWWPKHQERLLKDINTLSSANQGYREQPERLVSFFANSQLMGLLSNPQPATHSSPPTMSLSQATMSLSQPATSASSQPMAISSSNSGAQPMSGVTQSK